MPDQRFYTSEYIIMMRPRTPEGTTLRGLDPDDQVQTPGGDPIPGEPWIKFSSAHSLEDARRIGEQVAGAIGIDNVLVIKVVPHDMRFEVT